MSTSLRLSLATENQTEELGRRLGELLQPGDLVLLNGDLGAGKTVMARGLARGLGVSGDYSITSPTFILLAVYPGRLDFFHADLYRLSEGEAADLDLLEEAAGGVLAVEWPERAGFPWPAEAVRVDLSLGEGLSRNAAVSGPTRVIEGLR